LTRTINHQTATVTSRHQDKLLSYEGKISKFTDENQ